MNFITSANLDSALLKQISRNLHRIAALTVLYQRGLTTHPIYTQLFARLESEGIYLPLELLSISTYTPCTYEFAANAQLYHENGFKL